jgi:hypothetical protein
LLLSHQLIGQPIDRLNLLPDTFDYPSRKFKTWNKFMNKPTPPQNLDALLPWYANHTLSAVERATVKGWLKTQPAARAQLAAVDSLRSAISAQPGIAPSPAVRRQLLARLKAERRAPARLARSAWWLGSAVAVVLLVALWVVVQPGIALQWSVAGNGASAYRVYRAPVDSEDFNLLSEVPAQVDTRTYTFTDVTSLPSQTYTYVVEVVTNNGQSLASQTVIGRGLEALPAQLALILTSLVAGAAVMLLIGETNRSMINAQ